MIRRWAAMVSAAGLESDARKIKRLVLYRLTYEIVLRRAA